RAATDFVRRGDSEKAGRMRYLYEVDIADPMLYELIINTEKLQHEAVVDILERLVRRPEMATTEEGRRTVASRALASRVQVALATHAETRRYRINVEAQGDVVTLEGTTALGVSCRPSACASSVVSGSIATPIQPRVTLPRSISWLVTRLTMLAGIANPMPWPVATIAVLIPMTSPRRFTSGPPELPGLIDASV